LHDEKTACPKWEAIDLARKTRGPYPQPAGHEPNLFRGTKTGE
jgi:hypothetical protein